jgi:hypothetical protein
MAGNVVEIVVKAANDTAAGFDEAKAGAGEAGAAMDEYAAATERVTRAEQELLDAQIKQTDAVLHLAEVEASDGGASADALAAAQDRVTKATLGSLDAQIRLTEAEARVAAAEHAAGDAAEEQAAKTDAGAGMFAGAGGKMKMVALGVAVGLGLAVKGAADFQQQTVKLVTSAGESATNLGMVQRGILALSSSTNTSTQQLASGMYMVESAGFHGAAGLAVLKASAQGAAAEGADLADVANAVTSGLNAYGMKAGQATSFTNQMVAAVGAGKMTMQDLASSLAAVLPIAASAHISFAQVGGAVATMTGQGMSARQATQDLASMIRNLLHPSATASAEMKALGLNALDVSSHLGKAGLTGTLQTLTEAILNNTHGGSVLVGYMHEMTPAAQGVARAILSGSISTKQLRTEVQAMNPEQAKLISLFDASATSATGLKQTFDGAMASMTGGATGLNVALLLGGKHAGTFDANVKTVAGSAKNAGANVKGWGEIQKEANFQIGSAVKAIKAMGDSLGLALLPAVTAVLHPVTELLGMIADNKAAAVAFAVVVGGVLAGALGTKMVHALKDMKNALSDMADGVEWAARKFGLLGAAEDEAAASTEAADVAAEESSAGMVSTIVTGLGAAMAATGAWIAEHAIAAGSFIAENVAMAASAVAAFIAENLATLGIIAAIAALIAAIVYLATHWQQVWGDIKKWADDAWHFLQAVFRNGIVKDLLAIWSLGLIPLIEHWKQVWGDIKNWTSDAVRFIGNLLDGIVRFYAQLPGRIMSALSSLPGRMLSFGAHIISMLAQGIVSAVGDVTSAMVHVGGEILDHIPHSPAKKGPLSGSGSPDVAGRKIAQMLGQGMLSGLPSVSSAAHRMAGAAAIGPAGPGGSGAAGAGGGTIQFSLGAGGSGLDQMFWTWFKNSLRKQGGDPGIVTRKVVFK